MTLNDVRPTTLRWPLILAIITVGFTSTVVLVACDKDKSTSKTTSTKTTETPEGTKKTTESTEKTVEVEKKK